MDLEETKRNTTTESKTTAEIYVVGILVQLAALAVWGLFWGHSLDGENSWSSWMSGLVAIYRRFLYLPRSCGSGMPAIFSFSLMYLATSRCLG